LDLKNIKQVVDLMTRADLSEFELEEEGFKLRLCRKATHATVEYAPVVHAPAASPAAASTGPVAGNVTQPVVEDKSIGIIKSPMVGTFYRAASPDSAAFVDVGSKVGEETTVCIIEAMKVMNEIVAEMKGTITEVLIENGEPVEFGQPLFKIKIA
jgi:acetyl-CoA carboxylase biotin carboxyl carrier protein